MIKKVLLLVLLTVFVTCGCTPKPTKGDLYLTILKRDKIIVGISYDSKPFGFVEKNGKVSGFEADLAKGIAYNLFGDENKVEFKNIAPQERIAAVLSGNVDMVISTMTITSERKKLLYFSEPYFISGQAICVKKDGKIDSHNDLLNKKIIVILGTTGERNIKRFAPNSLIMGFDDNSEAISEFKSGVGDALTTDDSLLQGLVMDNDKYVILPERLTQEPYGIAFKKSKQTKFLKNKINEILETMRYDGTMDNIYNKWGL